MPLQFDLQLSGEHGVFHYAGILEIGELPMVCGGDKPTRLEALKYYRKVRGARWVGIAAV